MPSLNYAVIRGNLTRELDISYTPGGKAVLKCTIGITEKFKGEKEGELKERSLFVPITIWDKLAESCQKNLVKGQEIIVQGKLSYDHWVDESGTSHNKVYVTANYVYFGRKPGTHQGANQPQPDNEELSNEAPLDPPPIQ